MKMKLFMQSLRFKAKDWWGRQLAVLNQSDIEEEINTWIGQHPGIKVANIKQSVIGPAFGFGHAVVFITVWYEDNAPSSEETGNR
jgi:hypothetical protein